MSDEQTERRPVAECEQPHNVEHCSRCGRVLDYVMLGFSTTACGRLICPQCLALDEEIARARSF